MVSVNNSIGTNAFSLMENKKHPGTIILVTKEGTGINLVGKYADYVIADVKDSEMELVPYSEQIVIKPMK